MYTIGFPLPSASLSMAYSTSICLKRVSCKAAGGEAIYGASYLPMATSQSLEVFLEIAAPPTDSRPIDDHHLCLSTAVCSLYPQQTVISRAHSTIRH